MTAHKTMEHKPAAVRNMSWDDLRKALRVRGSEIGALAARGDKLAQKLMAAYRYVYDHPGDHEGGKTLMAAFEDYMARDLRVAEVKDLGSRLGHRLPEAEKVVGARIFVPSTTKQ